MEVGFPATQSIATARWMEPDEVEERFPYEAGSFWMGRNPMEGENPAGFRDDRHVMLVSGSRGGKGVSVIVPNLCLWPGSLVVVDPKGENATLTAARRGRGSQYCTGIGQAVHVLDPMGAARVDESYRARFNPLDALNPDSPHVIDDATRIADAIVEIGQGESRQWDEGARSLIRTLILHVLTDPHYDGQRNLVTVRRLILSGERELAEDLRRRAQERGEDGSNRTGQVVLWELARRNEALGGMIAASADSFAESAKNSPKQYNSYRLIAERCTEFLDSPGMAECVSSSSFNLADLKTDPKGVSVYLSLPQRFMSTHYRWLRMMIALTITEMETVARQPASGAPVLMVLDEFAGLRRMEIIENGVAQIAGFGVKLFFAVQSLEQLKAVYPDRWETFLANCGVRLFFATTDNFTNQYVSDMLGEQEIVRITRNSGESTTDTTSNSESFTESQNEQHSTSETRGEGSSSTRGGNTSSTKGGNRGRSRGSGTSRNRGVSYDPSWFFAERTGKQRGSGSSTNEGRSSGTNWSDGMGRNWSKTSNRNRSRTITKGTSSGTSTTRQSGTSYTQGRSSGESEQIFKKPLLTKDELTQLFTRIDDPEHRAYPGLALVSLAGQAPILLRRTPYYADPAFTGLFDPHPDHPAAELKPPQAPLELPPSWPRIHGNSLSDSAYNIDPKQRELLEIARREKKHILGKYIKKKYETLINASLDIVSSVFLDTELHDKWFRVPNQHIGAPITSPHVLSPGSLIPSGFITGFTPYRKNAYEAMRIQICCLSENYNKIIFFDFTFQPRGEDFTQLELEKWWHDSDPISKFLEAFGLKQRGLFPRNSTSSHPLDIGDYDLVRPDVDTERNFTEDEVFEDVREICQNFKYICEDIVQYGRPHFEEGKNIKWVTASAKGQIRFHNDPSNGLPFKDGDEYDAMGFVDNVIIFGKIERDDYKPLNLIVRDKGIILDILKYDGDTVEKGDRILKYHIT